MIKQLVRVLRGWKEELNFMTGLLTSLTDRVGSGSLPLGLPLVGSVSDSSAMTPVTPQPGVLLFFVCVIKSDEIRWTETGCSTKICT